MTPAKLLEALRKAGFTEVTVTRLPFMDGRKISVKECALSDKRIYGVLTGKVETGCASFQPGVVNCADIYGVNIEPGTYTLAGTDWQYKPFPVKVERAPVEDVAPKVKRKARK